MNLIGSFLRKYTGFSKSIVVCDVSRLVGLLLFEAKSYYDAHSGSQGAKGLSYLSQYF